MQKIKSENRLLALDSLRGIAALIVLMFHYTMGNENHNFGFELGTTGVDLFFIISGFVIFMSLSKVSTVFEFIFNRICRLYPTYWISVTFTFVIILVNSALNKQLIDDSFFENYSWNLSMFQFYANKPDIDGPYWTMIIEMLFYLLMIVLFCFRILNLSVYIGLVLAIFFYSCMLFLSRKNLYKTINGRCTIISIYSTFFWWNLFLQNICKKR